VVKENEYLSAIIVLALNSALRQFKEQDQVKEDGGVFESQQRMRC